MVPRRNKRPECGRQSRVTSPQYSSLLNSIYTVDSRERTYTQKLEQSGFFVYDKTMINQLPKEADTQLGIEYFPHPQIIGDIAAEVRAQTNKEVIILRDVSDTPNGPSDDDPVDG